MLRIKNSASIENSLTFNNPSIDRIKNSAIDHKIRDNKINPNCQISACDSKINDSTRSTYRCSIATPHPASANPS